VVREAEQNITDEQSGVEVPSCMHARTSAPGFGMIHDVVVDQGEVVHYLDGRRGIQRPAGSSPHRLTGQNDDGPPDALAPPAEHIPARIGQVG